MIYFMIIKSVILKNLAANNNYRLYFFLKIFGIYIFSFFTIQSCNNSAADMKKYFSFMGTSSGSSSTNPKIYSAIPATGDKNLPRTQKIAIIFDRPMNINNCMLAFSVSPAVRGYFETTDTTLTFTPSSQWDFGSYTYTITKACEDKNGYDLKDVFTANFSIGSASNAGAYPTVTSATIYTGTVANCNAGIATATNFINAQVIDACMGNVTTNKIRITFSRAMEPTATLASIAISPSLASSAVWESDTVLSYTSDASLAYNQRYTMNISTSAQDTQGNKLQFPITASFLVGTANLLPTVSSVQVATGTPANCQAGVGVNVDILTNAITTGCPGNPNVNSIVINFGMSMDTSSTQNAISFSPSISGSFTWSSSNTVLTYTPNSAFQPTSTYTVTIAKTALSSNLVALQNAVTGSFTVDATAATTIVNTITVQQGTLANCNAGTGTALDIITSTVTTACLGNPTFNSLVWNFNYAMNTGITQASISISPSISGNYAWSGGNQVLTLTPTVQLTYGVTYTVTISTSAKTSSNI